jgi:hypothetical protein
MNTKTLLIPLVSFAAIGTAALLTIGPPTAPACVQVQVEVEKPFDAPEPPRRFARPPAPPLPAPRPLAVDVG